MHEHVTETHDKKAKLDALDALLYEMLVETGGPLTADECAEIDQQAGWAEPRRVDA
jgi:hypothetical protein